MATVHLHGGTRHGVAAVSLHRGGIVRSFLIGAGIGAGQADRFPLLAVPRGTLVAP